MTIVAERLGAILVIAALTTGCSVRDSLYFPQHDRFEIGGPVALGDTALIGIESLSAEPGDVVTLLSAQARGIDPSLVTAYVMPSDRAPGFWPASEPVDGVMLLDIASPIAGYEFDSVDGSVEVVFGIRATGPGTYFFSETVLHYRVNQGAERIQTFAAGGRVCVSEPAPTDCGPGTG